MPQRVNVIRLSEAEREVLRQVTAKEDTQAVAKAVTTALRQGAEVSRSAAGHVEANAGTFQTLREELDQRMRVLSALPVPEDVKAPLVGKTQSALNLADEVLGMLTE